MPIKPAKKTDVKPTSSSKSKAIPKKDALKKPIKKSKKIVTSDESTSESESSESSDSEPVVRRKSTKDKKKPKIITSESESDDEIAVETVITKRHDDTHFDKLSDGLISIAHQMAKSNEMNIKLMELMSKMFDKLELRVEKEYTTKDVFDAAEDVIKSGGSIIIGDALVVDETNTHRFGSIGDFTKDVGKITSTQSFNKTASIDDNEEEIE